MNLTSSSLHIRPATVVDAPIIALLGRTTFGETFGHLFHDPQDLMDYYDRTFSVSKLESSLNKSRNRFWLAFVDRLPVGYAKLKLDASTEFISSARSCQLQKIYVLKDFLSLKIGYALQETVLRVAVKEKYECIWLSVLAENERAIHFYLQTGFEQVGQHGFSIGQEDFEFVAMAQKL